MPPNFESKEYWDQRFTDNQEPFEWLASGDVLHEAIGACIKEKCQEGHRLRILHIGCGTSDLGFQLCRYVRQANDVCNSDYSTKAIQLGQDRERRSVGSGLPESRYMRWQCEDLLSLEDVRASIRLLQDGREQESYDLVMDKSTTDAICCGSNVDVHLPYGVRLPAGQHNGSFASIYPLNVLAVHLAALTPPKTGRWVVLSYSADRFPFLSDHRKSGFERCPNEEAIESGFPDPEIYWRLTSKRPLKTADELRNGTDGPHRPSIEHWLYVLERTDVRLEL